MATIYCSAKLTTLLGLNKKKKEPEIAAVDPHSRNGTLFFLNKRKCLLFMHKPTFLVPDIVKKDLDDFNGFFRQHFTDQLLADQLITEKTKTMLDNACQYVELKSTDNDKHIIGSMNDCIFRIKYHDSRKEDTISLNSTYIGQQLNQTPMGAVKYAFPVKLMKEFLNKI